jgi:hypothetical protein
LGTCGRLHEAFRRRSGGYSRAWAVMARFCPTAHLRRHTSFFGFILELLPGHRVPGRFIGKSSVIRIGPKSTSVQPVVSNSTTLARIFQTTAEQQPSNRQRGSWDLECHYPQHDVRISSLGPFNNEAKLKLRELSRSRIIDTCVCHTRQVQSI